MPPKLFWGANSVSAVAAGSASLLSLHLMYKHAKYYCNPGEQRQIIRILLMIPIYAVDCAIATWEPNLSRYVDPIRDCYEAFVLYSFMAFLKAALSTPQGELSVRFEGETIHHLFPFNICFNPTPVNRKFFAVTERGVIQYMLMKPLLAVTQLILTLCHKFDGGVFDYTRGYTYVLMFTNLSQTAALYCLIYIYHAIHKQPEMQGKQLLGKLLCIKAVVFFSFWQTCLFAILEHFDVIRAYGNMSADVRATALDDFILCLEMVAISIAHRYVFSYKEYRAVVAPVSHALKTSGWRSAEDTVDHAALPEQYRDMSEAELEAAAAQEKQDRRDRKGAKRGAVIDILNVKDVAGDVKEALMTSGATPESVEPFMDVEQDKPSPPEQADITNSGHSSLEYTEHINVS